MKPLPRKTPSGTRVSAAAFYLLGALFACFARPAAVAAADDIKIWFSNPAAAPAASPLSYDPAKRIDEALYDFIGSAALGTTMYVAIFEMNLDGSGAASDLKDIKGLLNAKSAAGTAVYVVGHSTVTLAGLTFPTTVYRAAYAGEGTSGDSAGGLMHNKFVVLKDSAVWLGSYNFTVSATLEQDNNAVEIFSPELARVYETEFINMYGPPLGRATKEFGSAKVSSATLAGTNVSGSSVTLPGGAVIKVYFNPYTSPKTIAGAIEDEFGLSPLVPRPSESISFALAWFSRTSIADAMKEALALDDKLRVSGVMDDQASNTSVYYSLKNSTTAITWDSRRSLFGSGLMHHKFGVIDVARKNARTITGSANWTNSGASADANDNDENIVIIYDPGVSKKYYAEFSRLFSLTGQTPAAALRKSVDAVVCYPSPARTKMSVGYELSAAVKTVAVKIYALSGDIVRTIEPATIYPGFYNETEWDLKNTDGKRVAPGLYFVKVEVETSDGKVFAVKKTAVGK